MAPAVACIQTLKIHTFEKLILRNELTGPDSAAWGFFIMKKRSVVSKIVEIAPSARPGQLSNPQIARAREALVHRAIAARSKSDLLDLCDANDLSGSAYTDEIAR